MAHKRIRYNDDAQKVRCEFWWDVTVGAPAAVNLEVKNHTGTAIRADAAADMVAADTLSAAVSSGDMTGTLTTGKAYVTGDRVLLAGGRPEVVELESYATSTKVMTFKEPCRYDHASSSAVNAWFVTDVVDTSTVASWPEGELVTLIWTPYDATPDLLTDVYEETGQVLIAAFDVPDLHEVFRKTYPNEYRIIESDLAVVEKLARNKLSTWVAGRGWNLETCREPERLAEPLLHLMAWFAAVRQKDAGADDRERAWAAYVESREAVADSGDLWFDMNQDEKESTDEEVADLGHVFIGPGRVGGF